MLNVCRGSWRCGRGSIAEAVAEAVNNFLSTTKEKRTKLTCIQSSSKQVLEFVRFHSTYYVHIILMIFDELP